MKISTKGLYAVRFMLYLTERGSAEPVSLKDVSKACSISKKYLEQIVPNLVVAKIVRSVRGAAGGYRLAKPASSITLLDVLRVTEGSLAPVPCLQDEELDCTLPSPCLEIEVWKGLNDLVNTYLAGITLQEVIDRESVVAADSYSI